jgi:hypothetical protein
MNSPVREAEETVANLDVSLNACDFYGRLLMQKYET